MEWLAQMRSAWLERTLARLPDAGEIDDSRDAGTAQTAQLPGGSARLDVDGLKDVGADFQIFGKIVVLDGGVFAEGKLEGAQRTG